ncbi:MAG TPA: alpha/beta hydrolase [Synechococcales cyanobacterium M55_K2018_004]|nr:alpha/beta hydrolase [Synechococcales cyanobacterium M55_K2018_004]
MTAPAPPDTLLFMQHGWADDNRDMLTLSKHLATEGTQVIAPTLNYLQTWIKITPLIQAVETIALHTLTVYPAIPIRIVGHSMGGLIWLEVLQRHPQWWERVSSLVLLGSPVGGADLGRIIDPLQLGVGIASDLGQNRKAIASQIAAQIPTLVIAGDVDGGSDGVVTVESTRFPNAQFVALPGVSHPALKTHPLVVSTILEFWSGVFVAEAIPFNDVVARLNAVPGITDGHFRDFSRAKPVIHLKNGGTVRAWRNPLGVDHVFVADAKGTCVYAGFVGWLHRSDLKDALEEIRVAFA